MINLKNIKIQLSQICSNRVLFYITVVVNLYGLFSNFDGVSLNQNLGSMFASKLWLGLLALCQKWRIHRILLYIVLNTSRIHQNTTIYIMYSTGIHWQSSNGFCRIRNIFKNPLFNPLQDYAGFTCNLLYYISGYCWIL